MASFTERIVGAARLDVKTYEEVEGDQTALPQAMAVVVLSALAAGIGASMSFGIRGLIGMTVVSLVAWLIWAALTWVIGTKLMPEPTTHADLGQMLRTIGFAATPGLASVLGIVPILGWIVPFIVWVWSIAAMVVAVRQALDYSSTGRAIAVCLIGWVANVILTILMLPFVGLGSMFAGGY